MSSSLISSLYMTDGSPVSLEYEDAGLFLVCMDVVEGRQRKVASLRVFAVLWDTDSFPANSLAVIFLFGIELIA